MSLRGLTVALGLLACAARVAPGQVVLASRAAERVMDLTLADAAVAVSDPLRPVIYFNPVILERMGAPMAAFILAHEEAHIALHHARLGGGVAGAMRLRQLELDADCLAARRLVELQPDAVRAAARFFRATGASRIDAEHPTGTERADRIVGCAGTNGPGEPFRPRPVRTDASETPGVR